MNHSFTRLRRALLVGGLASALVLVPVGAIAPASATTPPAGSMTASSAMGNIPVNEFTDLSLTVTNTGGAPLSITNVTFAGANPDDFFFDTQNSTCFSAAIAPAATCLIDFTFFPSAVGARSATFSVVSNASVAFGGTLTGNGNDGDGYYLATADGQTFSFGTADDVDDLGPLNKPIVGAAPDPAGGYWQVASDGGIFAENGAGFFGSAGSIKLNQPIVGMASTPDGQGYWLVASDGGIFAYGDAKFFGSTGSIKLNKPMVGMAAMPDGLGYWLVASDGGIFAYGSATFMGSTGAITLNKPVVGMSPTADGDGYWLVASDGGIFAYGAAKFHGSTGSMKLNKPIVGMESTATGAGYWLVSSDGGIFAYGGAAFLGSEGGKGVDNVIGIART